MAKLKTGTTEPKTEGDFAPGGNARGALFSFVERVERLEEEKAGLSEDLKEVYGEAKGVGFDAGILRKVISRRKMDKDSRLENDAIMDLYERTIEEEEKARFASSVEDGE